MLKNNLIILSDNKKLACQLENIYSRYGVTIDKTIYCDCKKVRVDEMLLKSYFSGRSDVALIMKNSLLKDYTKALYLLGIFNLYIYSYDIQLDSINRIPTPKKLIYIENKKPRLSFLDVEIAEHCNLKCKGCLDFSNLVKEKKYLNLDLYRDNLLKLKEYFWGIEMIHLQGGEPLLNPDFLEYVKITHEIFPDCDIHIVTNGLLATSVEISKLKELKMYNCTLNISQYPIVRRVLKKTKQYLIEASVVYTITMPRYIFAKKILLKPHNHPDISYENCLIKRCTGMHENYISPCMFPLHIYKFNNEFSVDLPETDKMDIYDIKVDGWKLIEILEEKPLEFCSYCHYGIVPFFWKQRKPAQTKQEDWIVQSNFLNSRVLPLFYKLTGSMVFKLYKLFSKSEIKFTK